MALTVAVSIMFYIERPVPHLSPVQIASKMVLTEGPENGNWAAQIFSRHLILPEAKTERDIGRSGMKGNARDQSKMGNQTDVPKLRREILRHEKEAAGLPKMRYRICF